MGASSGLAALLRREFRSETNKRFLRNMPAFRAEREMPERLSRLLKQLDQADRGDILKS